MIRLLIVLAFSFLSISLRAQSFRNVILDQSDNGRNFKSLLLEIEKNYPIDFIYNDKNLDYLTVRGITGKQRLTDFLNEFLSKYRLLKVNENILFIVGVDVAQKFGGKNGNYVVFKESDKSQISISGIVRDQISDEPLIQTTVYFPELGIGGLTDKSGKYSINQVPQKILTLDFQYVGYESTSYLIGFSKYGTADANNINVSLMPESRILEGVTITAERKDINVTKALAGIESMNIEKLKAIPAFLGEVDPVRSITTLPGVSTAGELASGFNVRGGETGQNLILQDGAPIYNPSHLFGFFSSFNPDMVNNVSLYKGGGPANFGGRISSVLDVSLRNGDAGKHSISGGIGLISSRLAVEGPLLRNKSSYLLAGRVSYCNWLIKATENIKLKNSSAQFYDLTGKIFHTLNENNTLSLSIYNSYDDFKFAADSVFSWGTFNTSLKWSHTYNAKMFSSVNVYNSQYYSEVESVDELEPFIYRNSINNIGLNADFSYLFKEEDKITAGIEVIGTLIEPGKLTPGKGESNIAYQDLNDQKTLESAAFVQADYTLTPRWSVSGGLRYSYFLRAGKDVNFIYDYNNMNGRYPSIIDTIQYGHGEVMKNYNGIEPRLSIRFLIDTDASIKASYYRGYQYLHLISNTTSTTPQDYWISSGPYLKPQIGDQFSVGYFKNFNSNLYEFSLEGFYKEVSKTVDYIEGADITLNPALEGGLSQGKGLAYGVELFLKKKSGKINGWIAYTYSRSLRRFSLDNSTLEINGGEYYPSSYDQPNNVSLIMNYQLGERTILSTNFNYRTGRPITIPVQKFSYDGYLAVMNYSERNEYRIPDYHRLDLSLTIKDKPGKGKRFKSEWVLAIFNLYGRKNAYSVYFDRYGTAKKVSILGSIFPSITYSFRY